MNKKLYFPIVLSFFLLLFSVGTFNYSDKLASAATVSRGEAVFEVETGRMLYASNADIPLPPASTTKTLTAIIIIEDCDLDEVIKVTAESCGIEGSSIYLVPGEKISVRDLLYGLMYQSGNDAAMVIASNVMPYDKFIEEMNRKAVSIGMKNTVFENPHGLDDDTKNYSTAYDMALLMRYATNNNTFMEITGQTKYTVDSNIERHIWYNKNKLLTLYKYATSGKIGYTTSSKHVFVSSAKKGEEELVIATIKDTDRFNTHKSLYEETFDKYDKYMILNRYTFSLKEDYYKDYHLYIKNDFEVMLSEDEKDKIRLEIKLKKLDKVSDNEQVGYVYVYVKDELVHKEAICAVSKESKLKKIKNWLFFWK